jgi:hypothetical protein
MRARHGPDGPLPGQRPPHPWDQGDLAPLLTAMGIPLGEPALPWVLDTWVGHRPGLRVLDPQQVVLAPDLHRVAPQARIDRPAQVMEAHRALLADRARQLAQP